MSQTLRASVFATAFLCLSALSLADNPLTIQPSAVFEATYNETPPGPVSVELSNEGPDARGLLHVSGGSYEMDYPVELPRGSHKRLTTYPELSYMGVKFQLITNRGRAEVDYRPNLDFEQGARRIALIGDSTGELALVRSETPTGLPQRTQHLSIKDVYCKPEMAPGRAVGYRTLDCVILGSGSERLTDDSVEALKLWVLMGGSVMFVGGASSPILNDPRWANVLPISSPRARTLDSSPVLTALGGEDPPPTPFSVQTGRALPGTAMQSDGPVPITIERSYGAGRILFLACNPFEAPLNRWEGRKKLLTSFISPTRSILAQSFVANLAHPNGQGYQQDFPGHVTVTRFGSGGGSYISTTTTTTYPPPPGGISPDADPFSTKLPSSERVFELLGAYFLVVVPINFLVLRKLKRGELAWFTAPAISLAFAAILFGSAQSLYSAKMSTASQGVIVAQQGNPEAMFVGQTQLFVPRAGRYDLKLSGVDSLGTFETDNSLGPYGGQRSETGELGTIDVGEIVVPAMQTSNLNFREVSYRQKLPAGEWFAIRDISNDERPRFEITNRSPYPVSGTVYFGKFHSQVISVEPGQTVASENLIERDQTRPIAIAGGPGDYVRRRAGAGMTSGQITQNPGDPAELIKRTGAVVFIADVKGFRPGPQIGDDVGARDSIRIAFFAQPKEVTP